MTDQTITVTRTAVGDQGYPTVTVDQGHLTRSETLAVLGAAFNEFNYVDPSRAGARDDKERTA